MGVFNDSLLGKLLNLLEGVIMREGDMSKNSSRGEINVVFADREKVKPGSRFGPVIRSVYVIECCTAGCGSVIINGREFTVKGGDCYVLLPRDTVIHTSDSEHPREGFWCAIDGISISSYLETVGVNSEHPFLPPSQFDSICRWVERLTQEWSCRDAGAQLRQTACAYGILGAILQSKPAAEKGSLIDMAIGLMQTHYPNALSVSSMADHVGLERTYFSELFKNKTGLSPYQYLTRLRIQKACQLLTQGHSITDTSYLVGMEPHNFGRVFKKEVGCAPRVYLRKLKSNTNKLVARSVHVKEK